jgi:carbon starvation protein CstA
MEAGENERQIAFIGYGGMLMESFVAIMAMIGASGRCKPDIAQRDGTAWPA